MSVEFPRHTLATLAYRTGKSLKDAPESVATTRLCEGGMSGGELLDHMADVLTWARGLVLGDPSWNPTKSASWEESVARFWGALGRLDGALAGELPEGCPLERVFQGPIADCLTHAGQLATLRRLAGSPVQRENFFEADIAAGRVGPDQHYRT